MKGRSGPTGVATTRQPSVQLEHAEQGKGRQSSSGTHPMFPRQLRGGRLAVAIAGLAIAFLIGVFFVSYGSKLYENWRDRRWLHQAPTLLKEGKPSKAAQGGGDLPRRHPDS